VSLLSHEHLKRLSEELDIVNKTLGRIELRKGALAREYRVQALDTAIQSLRNEKVVLELKIDALRDFLT